MWTVSHVLTPILSKASISFEKLVRFESNAVIEGVCNEDVSWNINRHGGELKGQVTEARGTKVVVDAQLRKLKCLCKLLNT